MRQLELSKFVEQGLFISSQSEREKKNIFHVSSIRIILSEIPYRMINAISLPIVLEVARYITVKLKMLEVSLIAGIEANCRG